MRRLQEVTSRIKCDHSIPFILRVFNILMVYVDMDGDVHLDESYTVSKYDTAVVSMCFWPGQ